MYVERRTEREKERKEGKERRRRRKREEKNWVLSLCCDGQIRAPLQIFLRRPPFILLNILLQANGETGVPCSARLASGGK